MEQIGTDATKAKSGNGKDKNAAGRKDDGQEAVPDPKALKDALPGIVKLLKAKDEATDALNSKVKAVAKKTGFLASVVRKIAKASDAEEETFEEQKRITEQMSLAFEELDK